MTDNKIYDVVIVGGGPAGLEAAVYTSRAGKSTVVIERDVVGGRIIESPSVKNIPGFTSVDGADFAKNLEEQAEICGCEFVYDNVIDVEVKYGLFFVKTEYDEQYVSRTLIIATGTKNRSLGLPNEEKYIGKGVAFCTVCDAPFFAGKNVAVVGGGNSAVTNAIELAKIAKSVTIIQNLGKLTAEKALLLQLDAINREKNNIDIILGKTIYEYKEDSDGKFCGVVLDDLDEVMVDGLFISIGMVPDNGAFSKVVKLDDDGYIITSDSPQFESTTTSGVFACGDCRSGSYKQVAVACGEAAVAALNAIHELN